MSAAAKKLLPLALLLALPALGHAQQVLLQTNVATDTLPARTGPNRRYFGHAYLGYALAAGPGSLGVRYGLPSFEVQLGGRLKRRLSPWLALNGDLRYAYLRYGLHPEAQRPAPLAVPHQTETISFHQAQAEGSLRFNVNRRRGNVVGRYVDVLAYGGYALGATYATRDDAPGGGQVELLAHQPAYLARWQGGVGLRLGSNSVAVVGRYRLSEALRPVAGTVLPQPPRWLLGIELGWF